MNCTRAEAARLIEHFTPDMVARAKFVGTPSQTADQIWPYIDAGATHCLLVNFDSITSGDFGLIVQRSPSETP
jgi:alkanesulfonate monooxygenase SsuD/methylene tetrahydromethanopterin reductase-like flavin-dependent oxidoreductase (luciferase family)